MLSRCPWILKTCKMRTLKGDVLCLRRFVGNGDNLLFKVNMNIYQIEYTAGVRKLRGELTITSYRLILHGWNRMVWFKLPTNGRDIVRKCEWAIWMECLLYQVELFYSENIGAKNLHQNTKFIKCDMQQKDVQM